MIDMEKAGMLIAGASSMLLGAWAWIERRQKHKASLRADVAESNAATAVFDSQEQLYTNLSNQIRELREEVGTVRKELHTERHRGRRMELHIFELERLMRLEGMKPPEFDPGEPA